MERFTLTPNDDLMWTVCDKETGVIIDFREGLFNDIQDVRTPANMTADQMATLPTTMREIGDWMAQHHHNVAMCRPHHRAEALWTLAREEYWVTMADALKSLIIDFGRNQAAQYLYDEIEDYLADVSGAPLTIAKATNLGGSISLLSDGAAWEALMMVLTYWRYKADDIDIYDWAHDLLWWPTWCPNALLHDDNDQDNEEE